MGPRAPPGTSAVITTGTAVTTTVLPLHGKPATLELYSHFTTYRMSEILYLVLGSYYIIMNMCLLCRIYINL